MKDMGALGVGDWKVISRFLPTGWEAKAKELGALQRHRGFKTEESLLSTLLLHIMEDCSLKETVVQAWQSGIVDVSSVALFKRLRLSGEWLRWMAAGIVSKWFVREVEIEAYGERRVRFIDGTHVQEPGSKGSSWRLHYSLQFPSLNCDEFTLTRPEVGESFEQFTVRPGDLLVGDRGFGRARDVDHAAQNGGDVLVRINLISLPLWDKQGNRFNILDHLRTLETGDVGDWDVIVKHKGRTIPGRVCAAKKTEEAAEKTRRKLRKTYTKGSQPKKETLEAAGYFFVFTTLDRGKFSAQTVLEIYRARWQVEIAFKRLKSLLHMGDLRKVTIESARSWIHGKLLVSALIEALLAAGRHFSPGDTQSMGIGPSHPCLWREVSFMFRCLRSAIQPTQILASCLQNWHLISLMLREAPRKRAMQPWKLATVLARGS